MKINKSLEFLIAGIAIMTVVLLFSSISGAAPAQNSANIGYIDMERLQNELPDYQRLQSFVKDKDAEFKAFQNYVITQHQNALKGIKEKADQEKKGKSAEEQANIDKRYNDEAQKKTDETKAQLEKKRDELVKALDTQKKAVDEKVRKLISEVAEEKKLSVVLDKGAVLYGGTDITSLVIEKGKKEASAEKNKK
ncbi:MAG TPA: OmpH family outer membrane protein [Bacillota bacterium]|nr:OmpH family outer membrane protein [Bacillota bacterium]HPT86521.1 OmpH family outer membrane protein [Bacillota bacterium]